MRSGSQFEVVVIGGGLAGLAAATYLARAGVAVTLFEKAGAVGGRAMTQGKGEFRLNLGPHALYRRGAGVTVLQELGVSFRGGVPNASGAYAVCGGAKHTLPGGFVSLLTTRLLSLPGKFETVRLLGALGKIDTGAIEGVSVREWLGRSVHHPEVRSLVQALLRLATYANDPERQSAGSAVAQLQLAVAGKVYYLDGGWQTLVDGLRAAAIGAGVHIQDRSKVLAIEHDGAVQGVRLAGGARRPADAVVAAAGPAEVEALLDGSAATPVHDWARTMVPVRAACLDVALDALPRRRATFALGVDRPLYLSVHSAVAKLAPERAAVIHVAKYPPAGEANDPAADRAALEGLLDLVQPGWRPLVREQRFLPAITVSHALVTAAGGGTRGRPGPAVPGVRHLYVAGDWVGPDGLLADASLASARRAAQLVRRQAEQHRAAA